LDYCRAEEIVRQPAETRQVFSPSVYQEALNKYYWCLGYVEARMDAALQAHAALDVARQFGVALSGPDQEKQVLLAKLKMACPPSYAPPNSVIVALCRWLSEHPDRLHKPTSLVAMDAFESLFPCDKASPEREPKTTSPAKN